MKMSVIMSKNPYRLCRLFLPAALGLSLAGCMTAQPGYKKAEKEARDLERFRVQVGSLSEAVARANAAMDAISQTAESNPHEAYAWLSRATAEVDKQTANFEKRVDEMRRHGAAYFNEWDQQLETIENSDIRQLALSRESQLRERYSEVSDLTRKAKEALLPFVSDLHDVRTLLGTELTVSGVGAAKQTIEKTQDKGAAVRDALTSLTREVNRIEPGFVLARSSSEPNSTNGRAPVLRR